MSFESFKSEFRTRIEQCLESHLPAATITPTRLHEAMRYAALNPGKRLRPLLTYATGHIFSAHNDDLDIPAMAVELIHAYSLVHDDLPCMDDDDLRRGRPTCHIQFDEATAVLAGDALQTHAFDLMINGAFSAQAENNRIPMLALLAHASGSLGMGGGQAIDLAATGQQLSLPELETMHTMKTGALISASVELGYLCSGQNDSHIKQALSRYSKAIGLAFQIKDDILDIEGDTEQLGKPKGSDQEADKATYPALLGLDGAKRHAQLQVEEALEALENLPYNTQLLEYFAQHIINRDS
ncbi:(2E,6E)-farnesyl diphosphate synthase [Pleionea sp. CnH1-48]|uniref:(2E,6E)-farnesyl diphosphate synthase n=1 Tax=Pleionea sp. CnH1-48 TaxID=2954494 RepID=UPI002097B4C7|nr:farnesyl diphosphate synthase [Pleionea sp. CnH1-48]MCO7226684.1 (2E,6E)-farnesyl diphosphate synthase [Pleionea sp. CnH1-48]